MLKPQKKIGKKELKEDKFVKTALQTKTFVEENYSKVLAVTAGVFGLIILIMAYSYIHGKNVESSSVLLGKAQLEYQNLNYSKAKNFLLDLFDEYAGTDAANQGLFLIANIYFQEKNIPEAKRYFEEFLDSYDGSSILLASGYAGYAACLENEQNYAQAAEYYLKAQRKDPLFVEAADYLYLAGKNLIRAGEFDRARAAFESIQEDYKESTRFNDAKAQLILLAHK